MALLFGPPGVGKGTQADIITQKYSFIKCSTGDMLRDEIAKKTESGAKVEQYLKQGVLVPDDHIFTIIEDFLKKNKNRDLLFDGFPRNYNQATVFGNLLHALDLKLQVAIEMHLSKDTIVMRLAHRRYCTKCGRIYNLKTNPPVHNDICDKCHLPLEQRTDDNEEVIRKRLKVYETETRPLVDYYRSKGIYHQVDAQGTQTEVLERIARIIDDHIAEK